MDVVQLMGSATGRAGRVIAGAALVGLGTARGGGFWALAAVGLVPLAAGAFNVCLVAPLAGAPLRPERGGRARRD